jgi:lipoprotein-releasing system permease protein
MNTPLFIARRYLFSKKSVNAINIISGISTLGVLIGSAALIIILSVFNGFEQMILNMFSALSPELRIEPATGKLFYPDSLDREKLKSDSRVLHYSEVLQEKVLLRHGQNQFIGTLRGVDSDSNKPKTLATLIEFGNDTLQKGNESFAVIGAAVHAYLGVNLEDDWGDDVSVYSPRKTSGNSLNPADEFTIRSIRASGIMIAQPQFDDYFITPLPFAQEVLDEYDKISAIEIDVKEGVNVSSFQKELSASLGKKFTVKNIGEQNPTLYKILNSEKWAIFLILTFVLIIAILNIIGSLTMLVIDKQKDIVVLQSLGANQSFIKRIFFSEGMFISLIGCIAGMLLGFLFCVLQLKFGFIKMSGADLITDVYPIALKGIDFILVFSTVFVISAIASFISSRLSLKSNEQLS